MSRQGSRKPMTFRRVKNQILNVVLNPFNMIVLASLVVLICLVAVPLADVLKTTFTLAKAEARRTGGEVGTPAISPDALAGGEPYRDELIFTYYDANGDVLNRDRVTIEGALHRMLVKMESARE